MPDPLAQASEVFSAPIESIIEALGRGISDAQSQLDKNSLATQLAIDSDASVSGLGLRATWYQFPRVDLQIKMSMSVVEDTTTAGTSGGGPRRRIYVQPVSAAFSNHFNYTADASSSISLSIVPVPGPGAAQAVVNPLLTPSAAQTAAFATAAKFHTVKDAGGKTIADPKFRLDINFNAANGLWFVLQYDALNPATTPVVVTVDDRTQQTHVVSTS